MGRNPWDHRIPRTTELVRCNHVSTGRSHRDRKGRDEAQKNAPNQDNHQVRFHYPRRAYNPPEVGHIFSQRLHVEQE